jgi:hypothetical protein
MEDEVKGSHGAHALLCDGEAEDGEDARLEIDISGCGPYQTVDVPGCGQSVVAGGTAEWRRR